MAIAEGVENAGEWVRVGGKKNAVRGFDSTGNELSVGFHVPHFWSRDQ